MDYVSQNKEKVMVNFVEFTLVSIKREKYRKIYNADEMKFVYSKSNQTQTI